MENEKKIPDQNDQTDQTDQTDDKLKMMVEDLNQSKQDFANQQKQLMKSRQEFEQRQKNYLNDLEIAFEKLSVLHTKNESFYVGYIKSLQEQLKK